METASQQEVLQQRIESIKGAINRLAQNLEDLDSPKPSEKSHNETGKAHK